ncbi:hypothetical protein B0J14DRAFT_471485 [Halenospora varia]|nr:hypothetical protein B0J14DRAFT_471485 [Halenospora varia]
MVDEVVSEAQVEIQKVILSIVTSESIWTATPRTKERTEVEDVNEQELWTTTITSEVVVTIPYPKITEPPMLYRRKLGSNHWDEIHEQIQGQKRDATQCPTDYNLCPKSLNGGCCPTDRVCGSASCLPTSAAPASACGKAGYIACGISDGGGCCPAGYVCGPAGCSASAGVTSTQTCSVNSFLCPASFGGGCCKNGMGCALSSCYTTSATTFTLFETYTTTDANSNRQTITSTIVSVTSPPVPTATASSADLIPKIASSAAPIAKTEATGTPSTNKGLSTPMIGGIIGGAVAFLAIVLAVAFCILRRLKTVAKVTAANSRTSSSGPSGRSRPRPQPVDVPDVDAMSVDPLMMTGSEVSSSVRRPSYQSARYSSAHEVEANSPPSFTSPFSPRSPPHTHYPRGYNTVPTSDSNYSQTPSGGYRNPSVDSTPPSSQNPDRGYFDLPIQSNRVSQGSFPTRRPSQHGRNWSNASDQSAVSNVSSEPAELDARPEDGRKSSLQRALYGLGMGRMMSRRRSDPVVLTGGPTKKAEWTSPISPGLGHIPEAGESQQHVAQYHSPADVGGFGVTQVREKRQRERGLSASQLRDAGLSNAQLREMTMFEANPYHQPPAPAPAENNEKP